MASRAELIDSLIKLLDHFKFCQQCDSQVLSGILDPCLLEKLNRLENNDSTTDTLCKGSDLASFIIQYTALDNPQVQSNGITKHDGMIIETKQEKDDESVSIISVSTTSDIADCDSSGVSSDPFSLLNIVTTFPNVTNHVSDREKTNSSELTETESVEESTFEMENSFKSDMDTTSILSEKEGSVHSSTEECTSNLGDNRSILSESTLSQPPLLIGRSALRDAFLQNKGSLEPKTPQNNSSTEPKTVQNNNSLETKTPQNNSSSEPKIVQNSKSLDSRSPQNNSSFEPKTVQNSSSLDSRSPPNNSSFELKTRSTSPGNTYGLKETVVYYRCEPATSSPCDNSREAPVYKLVTTSDINSGKLLKKRVELQGTITRCYVVKSLKDLKLLNFTDSKGVTQATLRGHMSEQYDEMLAADIISVKGVCEKRFSGKTKSEKKLHHAGYEVVVESWSRVRDKENKPGNIPSSYRRTDRRFSPNSEPRLRNTESRPRSNESRERNTESRPRSNDSRERKNGPRERIKESRDRNNGSRERIKESRDRNNGSRERIEESRDRNNGSRERIKESRGTDYVGDEPRFGSTDIRYMDTEPRTNRDVGGERCRNVVNGEQGAAAQRSTRNLVCTPPPLLSPVENRGPSGLNYSPTIFISDVTKYMNSNIVTWGGLSDVTPSSATLHKSGTKVLLKFNAPYQVASSLVIVEGIPDKNNKNQTILTVERIEDLNQKHVACLKFLATPVREECKSVKKISELPKIINGSDIQEYFGKFVIMRAKLVDFQHGGKRGLSKGCVVCGDGVSINFSCLPFVSRNSEVNLGDQVVLIGKVDIVNKRSQQSAIPWITIDHLQVIPDKEADSILGFTKSAIYEALKQIVLDTLKNDDRASECDPWSFLRD